ncbi:DUF2334 domain-containing protein [Roseateles cellulosilyticus]|uniref:Polysaccharide deacetylase family protein n=1 Tax=Pelomonas cellulosilytica TaxID=2906762 RepID=A0ABS8XUZ6_9BURK|nr:polysaccharide deacetylase family protein [Pelomonas sp. P8]MCE4553095.1 polysaccharide deacetylase family protein [Pelomonas sp. P8]
MAATPRAPQRAAALPPTRLSPPSRIDTTEACTARDLCVVLHDVAPARWDGCRRVLDELQHGARLAGVRLPLTLLVVPRLHGDDRLPAPYLRWLHAMRASGHELALHGLTHRDEGPPPRGLRERLLRQHYTAREGEFAALSHAEAGQRVREGRAWARQVGLPMDGFVAPAWLMNAPSLQAVQEAGFTHTCTLTQVISLPDRHALAAPALVFSTRSGWRRHLSLLWNERLARRASQARLLRLELHPADADHPAILRCWTRLLLQALQQRVPVRLAEAARLASRF